MHCKSLKIKVSAKCNKGESFDKPVPPHWNGNILILYFRFKHNKVRPKPHLICQMQAQTLSLIEWWYLNW